MDSVMYVHIHVIGVTEVLFPYTHILRFLGMKAQGNKVPSLAMYV